MILPKLNTYISDSIKQFDMLSTDRKELLLNLANYIKSKIDSKQDIKLMFICTHNSRRSHISQLWAHAAAIYYGFPEIGCYSAGTEATAFNPSAVHAMQNAGFDINKSDSTDNPKYMVALSDTFPPVQVFSKTIADPFNPQEGFAAIMTCNNADEACPVVNGADYRLPIKYEDPKVADDTPEENRVYAERCKQISIEMLYAFSLIN